MVWGCISVHGTGGFICVKIPLMQRLVFCRDMCYHQGDVFSQEARGYFSRTMPDLILQDFHQCGFIDTECVCVSDWPDWLKILNSARITTDSSKNNCNNYYAQFLNYNYVRLRVTSQLVLWHLILDLYFFKYNQVGQLIRHNFNKLELKLKMYLY